MNMFEPRRKKRFFGPLFLLVILIGAIWSAGFLYFTTTIPRAVEDEHRLTDAIVVLTGGTHRLNTGLALLAEKKAEKMLISGVYRGVDLEELLRISQQSPQELECCIDIGHEADDTRGNARETTAWIEKTGYKSIRLVTANYHMPRSLLEFSSSMPYTVVVPHPVFPEHVKVDEWWQWPGTAMLLASEYNKYLMVWLRVNLADLTNTETKP